MTIFNNKINGFPAKAFVSKMARQREYMRPGDPGFIFSTETASSFRIPPRTMRGLYLGVGSHQNFDHIVNLRPDHVALVDISRNVPMHLAGFRAALKVADNPFQFLALISGAMTLERAKGFHIESDNDLNRAISEHLDPSWQPFRAWDRKVDQDTTQKNLQESGKELGEDEIGYLSTMLRSKDHVWNINQLYRQTFLNSDLGKRDQWQDYQNIWLRNLNAYSFLRGLAVGNRIGLIEGDIADPEVSGSINKSIIEISQQSGNALEVTSAYFSNVDAYVFSRGNYANYVDALKSFPWGSQSIVLRTCKCKVVYEIGDAHSYLNKTNDPYSYQVLEGRGARFFDEEPLPESEEELVKLFLFKETANKLLLHGASFPDALSFVKSRGNGFFKMELNHSPAFASLDFPAIEREYLLSQPHK